MNALLLLIPIALGLGVLGLVAFLWSLKSGQFDDLDGAAYRILFEEDDPGVAGGEESRGPDADTDTTGETPAREDTPSA